jgi:hypothetical protein
MPTDMADGVAASGGVKISWSEFLSPSVARTEGLCCLEAKYRSNIFQHLHLRGTRPGQFMPSVVSSSALVTWYLHRSSLLTWLISVLDANAASSAALQHANYCFTLVRCRTSPPSMAVFNEMILRLLIVQQRMDSHEPQMAATAAA